MVKGAITNIISETGNKELKGIKMQAIWQMVGATITHTREGWINSKEENSKLQTIFNEEIKKPPYFPKGINDPI